MLAINGRFLTQRRTGTQRYAYEVTRRLISTPRVEDILVLMPTHKASIPRELAAATKQLSRFQGHLWEQFEVGRVVNRSGRALWSAVNVGPVNANRHVVTIHD